MMKTPKNGGILMKKAMLPALVMALLLLLPLFAHADEEYLYRAVVANTNAADRLNLRKKPSSDSDTLGRFYSGTPVTVLSEEDGWAHVRLGNLYGYMNSFYLMRENRNYGAPSLFYTAECARKDVSVRAQPKNSAEVLGVVAGKVYVLGDIGDDWRYIYKPDFDLYGYVRANQLKDREVDIPIAYLWTEASVYAEKELKKEIARYHAGTPVHVVDITRSGYAEIEIYGLEFGVDLQGGKPIRGFVKAEKVLVFRQPWEVSYDFEAFRVVSRADYQESFTGERYSLDQDTMVTVIGECGDYYHIRIWENMAEDYAFEQSSGYVKKSFLQPTGDKAGRIGPDRLGFVRLPQKTDEDGYLMPIETWQTPKGGQDDEIYQPFAEVIGMENGVWQLRQPGNKSFFVPMTEEDIFLSNEDLSVLSRRTHLSGEWTADENSQGLWELTVEAGQKACLTITPPDGRVEIYDVAAGEKRERYAVFIPEESHIFLTGTGILDYRLGSALVSNYSAGDYQEDEDIFRGSGRFYCPSQITDQGNWFDYTILPIPGAEESYLVIQDLLMEEGEEIIVRFDEELTRYNTSHWTLYPGSFLEVHNCIIRIHYGNG